MAVSISLQAIGQELYKELQIRSIDNVDLYKLPALDNYRLMQQYKAANKKGVYRFAEPREVNISPYKTGTWDKYEDLLVWRQRIASPNAHSINLGFTKFNLPSSAELFIYDIDKENILGPLTINDIDAHLQYWSPMVIGDEIVIELRVSKEESQKVLLELSKVNHDFANAFKSLSGSCNLDVECGAEDGFPLVDEYRDIIRSVGAYTLGGIDACSGTLINNAKQDCTPFFLTANHCGITNNNAATVVVYWNYNNPTCRQPLSFESGSIGNGIRNQSNSGAILRSSFFSSDFALVELDDPIDPSHNLYFAGWNRQSELPDTSLCIHHPGVEEKRISFEFNRLEYDINFLDSTHLRVMDWDVGTTEGGSSGSGIFNSRGQLLGQLEGGNAACGNDFSDFYGWIRFSWKSGGLENNTLQPWLDPDDTGIVEVGGRDCSFDLITEKNSFSVCGNTQDELNIELQPDGLFQGDIQYSVSGIPTGISAQFDFNSLDATVSNFLNLSGFSSTGNANFTFIVSITDGVNSVNKSFNLAVFEDVPEAPLIVQPADGVMDQELEIDFKVKRNNTRNQFQLATDPDFNNIQFDMISDNNEINIPNLLSNQTFYWRAKSFNDCGESAWSDVYTFTTGLNFCTVLYSKDTPVNISSENPVSIESTIASPYGIDVSSVSVPNISGKHSFVGDLGARLNFNGKSVNLFSNICGMLNDFNLGFDDRATLIEIGCPPTSGELFKPRSPFLEFKGDFGGGDWILNIADSYADDGGTLDSWELEFCFVSATAPILVPDDHRYEICNTESIEFETYVDYDGEYEIEVLDKYGQVIESSFTVIGNTNIVEVILSENNDFVEGPHALNLVDKGSNALVFGTFIDLVNPEDAAVAEIVFPVQNSSLTIDVFNQVEWASNGFNGQYVVELSNDPAFDNLLIDMEGSDATVVDLNSNSLTMGDYYLRVGQLTANCGYIYSEVVEFTLGSTSSTDIVDIVNEFLIYPNPFENRIDISSKNINLNECQLRLLDTNGKNIAVDIKTQFRNKSTIELTDLTSGIFILEIYFDNEVYRKKLIRLRQ